MMKKVKKKKTETNEQTLDDTGTFEVNEVIKKNQSLKQVRRWMKKTRFRKCLIGGVNEADVWKKIGELNTLYETALAEERARYDALLEERAMVLAKELVNQQGDLEIGDSS